MVPRIAAQLCVIDAVLEMGPHDGAWTAVDPVWLETVRRRYGTSCRCSRSGSATSSTRMVKTFAVHSPKLTCRREADGFRRVPLP